MFNIYLLSESYLNGISYYIINILTILIIIVGILVIIVKNPILSVLCLIFLYLLVSLYLIFLGMDFIGISYLLVYVGAVSILFLFILMLINIRLSELFSEDKKGIPIAIIFSLQGISYFNRIYMGEDNVLYTLLNDENKIIYVTSNYWESSLINISDIFLIGNVIYSYYFIHLILISIILLLAMVGSIIITIKQLKVDIV